MKVNYAVSEGAQSFAQNFASDYFDWQNSDEGIKTRVERLQPYLLHGLDKQAGLSFEGMEWNSSLSASQVWNIEETGKDSALITLRVEQMLNKTTHKIQMRILLKKMRGPYEKYFVVPIQNDGKSFVVHQITLFYIQHQKNRKSPLIPLSMKTENSKIPNSKKKLHQHSIHF